MKLSYRQHIFIAIFCSVLLGTALWAIYAEYNRPWKHYQKEFAQLAESGAQKTPVNIRAEKVRQLWLRELGEVDRCTTCHLGANKPGFEDAPQPYKTHSGNYLKKHPVETFGCVICHEGQGTALTVEGAHGEVGNWPKPVLKGVFAQSSCGKCHVMEQALPLDSELGGAPVYSYGWRLFQEYGCTGCHQLKGNKRPDYIAPSLTSIGSKVNKDWMKRWLKNPKDYLPSGRMPRFNLTKEEIENVADYLMSRAVLQYAPTVHVESLNKYDINDGEILFTSLGCSGCHKINSKGSSFAPDLSDIGSKVNPQWLFKRLQNPGAFQSKKRMPDMKLGEDEVRRITAYLMTLKRPRPAGSLHADSDRRGPQTENIEKGKKLVRDLGCAACHEIEGLSFAYNAPELDGIGDKRVDELFFGNITGIEKDLIRWMKIKVRDPGRFNTDRMAARMPDYNFNEKQAEAMAVFLLGRHRDPVPEKYTRNMFHAEKADIRGKRIFETYNCLGCHQLDGKGGTLAPVLTGAGKKSRPEWLFSFLKNPDKIRPPQILKAGMPDFNLSDSDIRDVIEYLCLLSGEPYPYKVEPNREIPPEDVFDGEKLYQEVFACTSCHTAGGRGGEIGPDHTDLASRLKREWIEQWLRDPQSITPDVRMPRYTFKDWEFEALTNYLMTMGKYRFVHVRARQ